MQLCKEGKSILNISLFNRVFNLIVNESRLITNSIILLSRIIMTLYSIFSLYIL